MLMIMKIFIGEKRLVNLQLKMYFMKCRIILLFSVLVSSVYGQVEIRNNDELMGLLKQELHCIYNYQFDEAYNILDRVKEIAENHPVVPFVEGLILYWKNNPLTVNSTDAPIFVAYMERCMFLSDSIRGKKSNKNDVELTFFSLISRAMLMLHYADNEQSLKVIPYADEAYSLTQRGSDMKDEFNEFYFSTGLYNYYRMAYPEVHPVYKPLLMVFKSGSKQKGLEQIKYAMNNTVFLRVESKLYLSYIYLHYENNLEETLYLVTDLYNEFPNNHYFLARQAELLILNKKYQEAMPLVKKLLGFGRDDLFSIMKGFVFKGILEEKVNNNYEVAEKNYLDGIKLANEFKSWGNIYKVYAYMGLSRIAALEGDDGRRKEYQKMANKIAVYDYIKNWE